MLRVDVTQQRWFSGEGITVCAIFPMALERSLGIPKMDERYQCVLKLDEFLRLLTPVSAGVLGYDQKVSSPWYSYRWWF